MLRVFRSALVTGEGRYQHGTFAILLSDRHHALSDRGDQLVPFSSGTWTPETRATRPER